jgi:YVTN family beta-propeller protein
MRTKIIIGLVTFAAVLALGSDRQALSGDASRIGGPFDSGEHSIVPTKNVCPWAYCTAIKTSPEQIASPEAVGRFEFPGFSVVAPQGRGWSMLPAEDASRSGFDILFRKSVAPEESAYAYAVGRRIATGLRNPREILRIVVDQTIKPGSRSLKIFNDSLSGASCVRWQMLRRDSGFRSSAEYVGRLVTSVSHYYGYACSHPDAPAYVVEIGYFETVPKGAGKPLVPEEGGAFLKALTFTRLGVHVTQLPAGRGSRGVAFGHGAVWLTEEAGILSRVDPKSGMTVARIPVGRWPQGFAVGLGGVWVPNWASDTVSRIDPDSNKVVATIPVRRGPVDVALGSGSVWVASEKDHSVSRLDPRTNQVTAVIPTNGRPVAIAADDGSIWVEDFETNEIWRIDSGLNRVVATIRVGQGRHLFALGHGAVWVSNELSDSISRIDPTTNKVVATIGVGHGPMGLALADGNLWVANFGDSTLLRIDPRTNQLKSVPIPIGESPFVMSRDGRVLWLLSVWGHRDYSTLSRIDF